MFEQPDQKHGRRGVLIIALLAVLFFVLVGLIFVFSKRASARARSEVTAENLYVVPLRLRVRTAPSATGPVVTTLQRGTAVKLIEARDAWARISAEGLEGWVERDALEKESARIRRVARADSIRKLPSLAGMVEREAAIHAGPGIFYPVIGRVSPGLKVKVFTRDHDFFAVDLGGEIAYVEIEAIDISASGTQVEVSARPPATVATTDTAATTAETTESVAEQAPPPPPEPEILTPRHDDVYPMVPAGGTPPRIIERRQPNYPYSARKAGVDGTVVLRGIVGTDGRIREVEILRDLPYDLGDEARRAVRRWRFAPAELDGRPIAVYYTVTVNFRLAR